MAKQFGRFLATGLLNTVAGYALIFFAQYVTRNPFAANTIGFVVGSGFSYYNHSRFTFRQGLSWQRGGFYASISIGCFLLNLVILKLLMSNMNAWAAQFVAISVYIVVNYLLLSKFVFPKRS